MSNILNAPKPRSGFFRFYLLVWAVLAVFSVGYLALIAVRPDLAAEVLNRAGLGSVAAHEESNQAGEMQSEVQSIRDGLSRVQMELAKLKTDQAGREEREQSIAARLVALEEKAAASIPNLDATASLDGASDVEPLKQKASQKAAQKGEEKKELRVQPPIAAEKATATRPSAAADPKILNPSPVVRPQSIETGSLKTVTEAAPVAFGPAVVKPAASPVGVRLATGPSVDALRLSWTLLADRHSDALKNLQPRYVTGDGLGFDGPAYDLVAGPLKNNADAQRVCKDMEAKGIACSVSVFAGNAL